MICCKQVIEPINTTGLNFFKFTSFMLKWCCRTMTICLNGFHYYFGLKNITIRESLYTDAYLQTIAPKM